MVQLKHSEMRVFDDALDMHGGYVLNFSDRTFSQFFDDEFEISIYQGLSALSGHRYPTSWTKRESAD